ncbi:MAG TPA: hypothetical protein VN081_05150, partial [Dongiaceae bacterium]|nr:hypothetical protein [Dongiaceae bacterium]
TFPTNSYVTAELYKPDEIYLKSTFGDGGNNYYEYSDGAIKNTSDVSDNQFNSSYPTFLVSPTGKQTFWYEPRDGKNTLLVGDESGNNTKTVGDSADYIPYGWYGQNDDFILLSKGGSELYISSPSKTIGDKSYQPLKITDYHKAQTYPGYGYGYGGQ